MNSTELHKLLRYLDTEQELHAVTAAEIKELRAEGYMREDNLGLTRKGMDKLDYFNRTGDGPEALKAMFRF